MDASEKKPFSFTPKKDDKKDKKDKSRHSLPNALQKTDDVLVTPQADNKKETNSKEEKKARRLSGTHHLHHHEKSEDKQEEKHDKKYYKTKYENENKLRAELGDVVKKLNIANEQLRKEIDSLKSQAHAVTETKIPEPVSFAKVDEKPDDKPQENKPTTENPTDNPTLNTLKSTSESATSYWDSVSNGLGTLYSYVPSFSGITSKLPTMPKIFEPVPNHHDSVSKPKI